MFKWIKRLLFVLAVIWILGYTGIRIFGYEQTLDFVSSLLGVAREALEATPTNIEGVSEISDFIYTSEAFNFFYIASIISAILGTFFLSRRRSIYEAVAILVGFYLPRQKKSWGEIYNAKSKIRIPFATIRIVKMLSGQEVTIYQTVADLDGRYRITLPENIDPAFKITVKAIGYTEFSKSLAQYSLWKTKEIVEDIPLAEAGNMKESNSAKFAGVNPMFYTFVIAYIYLFSILSFLITIYDTLLYFGPSTYISLLISVSAIVWNTFVVFERLIKKAGKILDTKTKRPVPNANVRVFNSDRQLISKSTDKNGVAQFTIESGIYKFKIDKPGFITSETDESGLIQAKITKDGYISKNLYVESTGDQVVQTETISNPFA